MPVTPATAAPSGPLRLTAPLLWHGLDGDWVVYQPDTGAIAEVDVLGATVLTLLELAPASRDALCEQLATETGNPPDALRDGVRDAVQLLVDIGLLAEQGGAVAW